MHGRSLIIGRTAQANLNHYWMVGSSFATAFGVSFFSHTRWRMLPSDGAASRYLYPAAFHVLWHALVKSEGIRPGRAHSCASLAA